MWATLYKHGGITLREAARLLHVDQIEAGSKVVREMFTPHHRKPRL